MAKCVNHPLKDAVASCSECGKPYCEICIEKIGDHHVCFNCLRKVILTSKSANWPKSLTLRLIIAGGAFFLLAIFSAIEVLKYMALFVNAIFKNQLPIFISTHGEATGLALVEFLKAVVYSLEAYGIVMNKNWSFIVGIVICILLLLYKLGEGFSVETLWGIASLSFLILILLTSRHELHG
ncbi:MAG: hypothetical protein QXP42_03850 [Candidatus Micrarchaeia archaeon]